MSNQKKAGKGFGGLAALTLTPAQDAVELEPARLSDKPANCPWTDDQWSGFKARLIAFNHGIVPRSFRFVRSPYVGVGSAMYDLKLASWEQECGSAQDPLWVEFEYAIRYGNWSQTRRGQYIGVEALAGLPEWTKEEEWMDLE
jgi:hypothetical protein